MMVARKMTKVFRQMVCGFDLLRVSDDEFYVCDVNGWSFVKNNDAYIEKAAITLIQLFVAEVTKRGLHRVFRRQSSRRILLGVVGVFRHADRTPKQKVKLMIRHRSILAIAFEEPHPPTEVVFKNGHPKLAEIRLAIAELLRVGSSESAVLRLMEGVLTREHEGLKIQIKPRGEDADGRCVEAQLVCKWGGWLTRAGEQQARTLGTHFVERVFGTERENFYLHDVDVTVNNERRVMHTANCFMDSIDAEHSNVVDDDLLGDNSHAKHALECAREVVSDILHVSDSSQLAAHASLPGLANIVESVVLGDDERTPFAALLKMQRLLASVVDHVNALDQSTRLYRDEPIDLLQQRWGNLAAAFTLSTTNSGKSKFDVSKLPDVFDYVSYDVCYNQRALNPLDLYPLFSLSQSLSVFVTEGQSGLTRELKLVHASLVIQPLLQRIFRDLAAIADEGTPRTRLFFTSASHVNALRLALYNNRAATFHEVGHPIELHFLSHIVFKVYRYVHECTSAQSAPQIEVHFSTGVDKNMFGIVQDHHADIGAVTPMIRIHNNMDFRCFYKMVQETSRLYHAHRSSSPASRDMSPLNPTLHLEPTTPSTSTPCGEPASDAESPTSVHRTSTDMGALVPLLPDSTTMVASCENSCSLDLH
jgi:hypothetical protein